MEKHCFECEFCNFELDDNLEYKLICENMLSDKYLINDDEACDFFKEFETIKYEPLHEKKRFVLNHNITIDKLEEVGFKKGGWINGVDTPKYYINGNLLNNFDIHLEITTLDDEMVFDDSNNVYVIDEDFGQPYTPFYECEVGFKVLNMVIDKYNEFMSNLVNEGVLQELVFEMDSSKKLTK